MRALVLALGVVTAIAIDTTSAGAECRPTTAVARVFEPRPGRLDIAMSTGASVSRDLALAGEALVWTSGPDVWRLGEGGQGCLEHVASVPGPTTPRGAASSGSARLAVSGDRLLEVTRTSVREVGTRDARVVTPIALPETPQSFLVHDGVLYTTVFRGDAIYQVELATGRVATFATLPRQAGRFGLTLAQRGDSLYVASYGQRFVGELPFATGALRVIARGFASGPTAIAIDDAAAYVYCESSRRSTGSLQRIELATGKASVLARDLINSDAVLLDEAWLYLRTLVRGAAHLVRVRTDGTGGVETVETGLPRGARPVASDDRAIYLDANGEIVRLDKAQLVSRAR